MLPDFYLERVISEEECLNAPTGAWCSLTPTPLPRCTKRAKSQCTYRCVVLPDTAPRKDANMYTLESQCTYRCVVLPDYMGGAIAIAVAVSMHLQVRGAP